MPFFKATLHAKSHATGVTNPTSMEVYLPIEAISALKDSGNEFQVLVNMAMLPKVHFEVGSVTASLKKTADIKNLLKIL